MLQEMMTAADTFGVEFPPDLDVKLKATLIYATFLIVSEEVPLLYELNPIKRNRTGVMFNYYFSSIFLGFHVL